MVDPALTLVLTFIDAFPFFEIDCGEDCRLSIQAKKEGEIAGRGDRFWDLRKNIFHPPDRFSLSFSPVEVSSGHPRSRGHGGAAQRQHSNGEGQI